MRARPSPRSPAALRSGHGYASASRFGGSLPGLAKRTIGNIRQNIGVALALKAAFLATTVVGITGLWPAVLADTGATVLVTMNALRLLGSSRSCRQAERSDSPTPALLNTLRLEPAAHRDNRPNRLDEAERPRALEEAIDGAERAGRSKGEDVPRTAILQSVAD